VGRLNNLLIAYTTLDLVCLECQDNVSVTFDILHQSLVPLT